MSANWGGEVSAKAVCNGQFAVSCYAPNGWCGNTGTQPIEGEAVCQATRYPTGGWQVGCAASGRVPDPPPTECEYLVNPLCYVINLPTLSSGTGIVAVMAMDDEMKLTGMICNGARCSPAQPTCVISVRMACAIGGGVTQQYVAEVLRPEAENTGLLWTTTN